MTPLAIIAKEAKIKVTGSDIEDTFITDAVLKTAGISVQKGFSKDHVVNVDLVIFTGAHGGEANVEVVEAKERGIATTTQGQAVGMFMKGEILGKSFTGISVAGSHGKTTTTAMIATILKENKMDPSYVIGTSSVPSLGASGHFGKGEYFVAEADEYATEPVTDKTAKLFWQHPAYAVITNIDLDHPDLYPTEEAVSDVFLQWIQSLSEDTLVVVCGDDQKLKNLIPLFEKRVVTYGFSPTNTYQITRIHISENQTFFSVEKEGVMLGRFRIGVSGEHNALNATGAIALLYEAGLSIEQLQKGLTAFSGSKRRSEYIGRLRSGAMVFDDYAHHPTEIVKTLQAFKKSYPYYKLVCIFQPHTYSRTKKLFEQFKNAFSDATEVILMDIYASLREEPDPSVSSRLLAASMQAQHPRVMYLPQALDVIKYIDQKAYPDSTIVITMGAGDVYKIAEKLIKSKRYG